MKVFIFSQFVHCPLVWVFQSRQLTNVIKNIQEQALKWMRQYLQQAALTDFDGGEKYISCTKSVK